jgi:hypothetical protein
MRQHPAISTETFRSATIVLPVMTETASLVETVEVVWGDCQADIEELLIVVCERTRQQSMDVVRSIKQGLGDMVVVHHQNLPFLGGAMREAFTLARGSHTVMMASDLETNPGDVRKLIAEAKKYPQAIITASRWLAGGGFDGYDPIKLMANHAFQRFFSVLYGASLSDLTYGYRLFPTRLIQAIRWTELRHPFLFETIVKPLRLGVPVVEIPTSWRARREGQSQNTLMRNLLYFRTGLQTRFTSRKSLLCS